MGAGFLVGLGMDPGAAQEALSAFDQSVEETMAKSQASFAQGAEGAKPLSDAILNQHQTVHLLAEEMGVHLPRAVVSGISEMLPAIGGMGSALLGVFAVEEAVRFGEALKTLADDFSLVKEAEKEISNVGRENLKIIEELSKKSAAYARSQAQGFLMQAAAMSAHIEELKQDMENTANWTGGIGMLYDKWSGKVKELATEEEKQNRLVAEATALNQIFAEDEVKDKEKAEKAQKKASEEAKKDAREIAEMERAFNRQRTELNRAQARQNQENYKIMAEAGKVIAADNVALERKAQDQREINRLELEYLSTIRQITGEEQRQSELQRRAGVDQMNSQVTQTKHLSLARKELIGITQDLQKVEDAFKNAMKGEMGGLEDLTQSAEGMAGNIMAAIGNTKAAAAVKGAFDAALSIEYMAQFIGSMGTDMSALGASIEYGSAAVEMFKVAGSGGGARASSGGGGGGSQSNYGRGGSGGSGSGSGAATPGGGNGGGGTTIHMHIEGLISPDNLGQVMAQMSQLAKGGQATLTASNALTNGAKLT